METSSTNWSELRTEFAEWLERIGQRRRILIAHDFDADGIAAAVVLEGALERAGWKQIEAWSVGRNRNAWLPENKEGIAAFGADAIVLLDLGSKEESLVPGVPLCLIDHHHPEGVPPEGRLITGYGLDPIPNTSLIAWHLGDGIASIDDLRWVAALGIISDLGERAPFPLLAEEKKIHKAKWLKEATTLVNAARRVDPELCSALRDALPRFEGPRAFVQSESPLMEQLRLARIRLKREMDEAKKSAPTFSGDVALVRVRSDCQVHPLIAQIWRSRLPKYHVLVANDGYVDGMVHFSGRSQGEKKIRDLLQSIELSGEGGEFGHGHDFASGGVLPTERWNALLRELGFDEEVLAR